MLRILFIDPTYLVCISEFLCNFINNIKYADDKINIRYYKTNLQTSIKLLSTYQVPIHFF